MYMFLVSEEEQKSLGWSYFKVFESTKSSTYNQDTIRFVYCCIIHNSYIHLHCKLFLELGCFVMYCMYTYSVSYYALINRLPLYEGSPRVLFALTDPFNGTHCT